MGNNASVSDQIKQNTETQQKQKKNGTKGKNADEKQEETNETGDDNSGAGDENDHLNETPANESLNTKSKKNVEKSKTNTTREEEEEKEVEGLGDTQTNVESIKEDGDGIDEMQQEQTENETEDESKETVEKSKTNTSREEVDELADTPTNVESIKEDSGDIEEMQQEEQTEDEAEDENADDSVKGSPDTKLDQNKEISKGSSLTKTIEGEKQLTEERSTEKHSSGNHGQNALMESSKNRKAVSDNKSVTEPDDGNRECAASWPQNSEKALQDDKGATYYSSNAKCKRKHSCCEKQDYSGYGCSSSDKRQKNSNYLPGNPSEDGWPQRSQHLSLQDSTLKRLFDRIDDEGENKQKNS